MKKQIKKCPCCESKKIIMIYDNLHDKNHFVEGKFSLIKCDNCNLEFLSPWLNEKELAKYYPPEDYYSYKKKIKLAIIYHNLSAKYYSGKNFIVSFLFSPFKSLLYRYNIDKNSRGKEIMEIGCGDGLQLEIYKKYGLKTNGLEPYGPMLSEREKKLGIMRKTIKEANFHEDNFDYIILKEVLEHIPNQKEVLEKCYKWLKPGGKIFIIIPNRKSLWNKWFKENWYGYDIPRHLYNYDQKNISFFLKKFGFRVKKVRVYDLPYMLDGSIQFYLYDRRGKKDKKIIFSNISKLFFTPISLLVTYMNQGSLMEVECTK